MLSIKDVGFICGVSVLFGDFIRNHLATLCRFAQTCKFHTRRYFLHRGGNSNIDMIRKFQRHEADAHKLKSVRL